MRLSFPGPAVAVEAVSKAFRSGFAVSELSFAVARGECFGLLGPNGAGKSTTLKMIYGVFRPAAGRVLVGGADVAREPRRAKSLLGVAPQEDVLDPELGVLANLLFHARYHGLPAREARGRSHELIDDMGLAAHAGAAVSHLSTGLRRRLVLARALLCDPEIVILDEPTRGLDRESREQYLERLRGLKARGVTMLLATHDLGKAAALCDRAALMDGGRIRRLGSVAEVVAEAAGIATPSPGEESR